MKQPTPVDFLRRWPRASMMLSGLIMFGDAKHSGDGRDLTSGRGAPLDQERYDLAYSYDKMGRHLLRYYGGENYDEETGIPHPVAVLWHAFNAVEAECQRMGMTVDDIIEMFTKED